MQNNQDISHDKSKEYGLFGDIFCIHAPSLCFVSYPRSDNKVVIRFLGKRGNGEVGFSCFLSTSTVLNATCRTKNPGMSTQLRICFVDELFFFIQDKHHSNLTPFTISWHKQEIGCTQRLQPFIAILRASYKKGA